MGLSLLCYFKNWFHSIVLVHTCDVEVLHISCNMGPHDLADMYALNAHACDPCNWAHAHVTTTYILHKQCIMCSIYLSVQNLIFHNM